MKLKLKQIWAAQQAMPKLLQKELGDVKASYWIAKNGRKLEQEIVDMEKARITLVKTYGAEDTESKKWSVPPAQLDEFNRKYEGLMDTEVDVDIKEISLDQIKDAKLAPIDIAAIDFMIKE